MDLLNPANILSPLNPISPLNPANQMNLLSSDNEPVAACIPDAANNFCQMTVFESFLLLGVIGIMIAFFIWFIIEIIKIG